MRTRLCGFTGKVREQCKLFHQTHTTITKHRISSSRPVLSGKLSFLSSSSSHRITGLLATPISTILRLLTSNKTREMALLKDSRSSPKCGPMVTNIFSSFLFYRVSTKTMGNCIGPVPVFRRGLQ